MTNPCRDHAGACALVLLCCAVLSGCAPSAADRGFVTLTDSTFMVHGRPFFPMAVNYIATLKYDGERMWVAPSNDYAGFDTAMNRNVERDTTRLKADMQLISELGLNTVRIVGCTDLVFGRDSAWLKAGPMSPTDTSLLLDANNYDRYLRALQGLLDAARAAHLRVILLTQLRPYQPLTEEHFARIADHFAEDTVILAYDLFNEPLYFDRLERPKKEAHGILRHWRELFDRHAPDQLYTLGLTGMLETFEFDPNMLGVDFISYHPYEYEPEQVRNEMRWYHDNVRVPWIIGETAIPADDDSVPYADQLRFARATLQQAHGCGALGYSWWQFQDVKWGRYHSDYMGVINRDGVTTTRNGLTVNGTPKPVVEAFRAFDPDAPRGECLCLDNYYNYSEHGSAILTGRLVDTEGVPIANGVVLGWNESWRHSYHTISKEDGTFELRGDFYFHHWMASATRWSMVRGDCEPNSYRKGKSGVPELYLGDLMLEPLTFADADR